MGKAAVAGDEGETGGIGRPTSDQNPAGHRGIDDGMSVQGDPRNMGNPKWLCAKFKERGQGKKRFSDQYLHQKLGLYQLEQTSQQRFVGERV